MLTATCAAQEKTIAYSILLDNTGSMRSQFDHAREIAKAVVHQIHDHGPVSVFDFHTQGIGPGSRAEAILRIEATQDESTLGRGIDSLYVEGGQTSLLDAVKAVGESLHKSDEEHKVIILITDGEDRVSDINQRTLDKFLKDNQLNVFAVGMVEPLDSNQKTIRGGSKTKAVELLNSMAKETGGRAVFPIAKKMDISALLTELAIPTQ